MSIHMAGKALVSPLREEKRGGALLLDEAVHGRHQGRLALLLVEVEDQVEAPVPVLGQQVPAASNSRGNELQQPLVWALVSLKIPNPWYGLAKTLLSLQPPTKNEQNPKQHIKHYTSNTCPLRSETISKLVCLGMGPCSIAPHLHMCNDSILVPDHDDTIPRGWSCGCPILTQDCMSFEWSSTFRQPTNKQT